MLHPFTYTCTFTLLTVMKTYLIDNVAFKKMFVFDYNMVLMRCRTYLTTSPTELFLHLTVVHHLAKLTFHDVIAMAASRWNKKLTICLHKHSLCLCLDTHSQYIIRRVSTIIIRRVFTIIYYILY